MSKLLPWRGKQELEHKGTPEPNPVWALAVGLVYVFRTGPGHRIMRELEDAVRKYANDPSALWRLVQRGEEVIDTTAATQRSGQELPARDEKILPPE